MTKQVKQRASSARAQEKKDPNKEFVDLANPHSWFLTADNLHNQACALYKQRGQSFLYQSDKQGVVGRWDNASKSIFLMGGFALENVLKAFLVYENPQWISNGVLSKRLRSHSLVDLRSMSKMVPYKSRYFWTLKAFEDGLDSWARYPCALSIDDSSIPTDIGEPLWESYLRFMSAHGRRLQALLGKGWQGPHGFSGKWDFQGAWLGSRQ